ncbi:MAG: glycosyltransferase [Bacillota bacterium]
MRIIFVNLHANTMLVRTIAAYIFKKPAVIKHRYLLDYLLNNDDYEVCNYINECGFTITKSSRELFKLVNLFRYLENNRTLKANGIDKNLITVLKNVQQIQDGDIVILYNFRKDNFLDMENVNAFKAVSMLHFSGNVGESDIINSINPNCLFNESNLKKNSKIYQRFYDVNVPWLTHGFVYAERFTNKRSFKGRKNLAFATGTITYRNSHEFIDTYGDSCLQPLRKQIKDNPEYFKDTIYCTSSDYNEENLEKKVCDTDNILVKVYKKLYNKVHIGKQKKYFSFDMVEAFNEYKMCIVAEECIGVPGIGAIEGMACGCAYIGMDIPAYRDWGMIPGEHFIIYDGTKEHLKEVIEYYQKDENQEELERIAKTGYEFVRVNFNGDIIAKRLMDNLVAEQKKWIEKNSTIS